MPEAAGRGGRGGKDAQPAAAAARSFWSGTITFGLVSIPVDFYAAARLRQKSMKMVDREGHALGRRYYAASKDKPLGSDDIVRGYDTGSGKMVVLDDADFDAAAPEESRDIELSRFVGFDKVPPLHFERPYFLAPAGRSAKAYVLLARTMEKAGKAGIGRLVMRGHEYLVAIIAEKGMLRAETLRHADELRTPQAVGLPDPAKPGRKQVAALAAAIDRLAKPGLDLDELEDREADRLQALSREKHARGQDVVRLAGAEAEDEAPAESGKVVDLMQLLRKSLGGRGSGNRNGNVKDNGSDSDSDSGKPKAGRKAPARRTSKPAGKTAPADELAQSSKTALYKMASELEIDGRSTMGKDQLVKAIAKARGGASRRAG